MESISIMGYDASGMLFFHDDSGTGRIHFWILMGILVFSYILCNVAILIWTQKKITNFTRYQAEIAQIKKAVCQGNADTRITSRPDPAASPNLPGKGFGIQRRDIRNDPAIRNAMEGLATFEH